MRAQTTVKEPARAVKKYLAQSDAMEERDRLILEHLPQVRLIASSPPILVSVKPSPN